MADLEALDKAHQYSIQYFVDHGRAPHFSELARQLGISIDEGRQLVHDLVEDLPAWIHPDTDLIASLAPFNSLPTHFPITVAGEQKWFGQCGLEALAVTWLFPRQTVRIDTPCLDCGDPVAIEMLDGKVTLLEPQATVGYAAQGFRGPPEKWPFR